MQNRFFLPVLVLLLFLAACTTGGGQPTATPTEGYPPPPAPPPTLEGYPAPPTVAPAPTTESYPQPTESGAALPPPPVKPTPRQELMATDPASVQLASGKVQVLEFFAFWCPTCRAMAPIVHGLESEFSGQTNFAYLDIDDPNTQRFKQALGYRVQPHIFLLDAEGNVLSQWVGTTDVETLRAAIQSALGQ